MLAWLIDIRLGIAVIVALVAGLAIIAAIRLVAIARLALTVTALIGFALQFARRFAQHAGIVFGMLQEILIGNAVVTQLGIAGQHLIFLDDLLWRAAHFTLWPRTVKHTVDDVAHCAGPVRFRTRTLLG